MDDPYTPGFAEALEQQMQVIRTWWSPAGQASAGFAEVALHGVRERHDIERFLHKEQLRETPAHVPLVLYVSSHGVLAPTQRHFLRLPATDDGRLPATGMPTNDLVVAALASHARHVLVIINACHAGAVARDLHDWWGDLSPGPERRLNVIVATDTANEVQVLEFSTVLRRAYEKLRKVAEITRPYLSIGEFLRALQDATAELNAERGYTDPYDRLPGPRELLPVGQLAEHVPTLPNPGYRGDSDLVPAERREVSTAVEELEGWLANASTADPGWYVTGRQRLNQKIADFLFRPAGVLIVTGAAATGKSSLLARAVTLSESTLRQASSIAAVLGHPAPATVPPAGSVTVAVSARNRSCAGLLEAIVTRLPHSTATVPPLGADAVRHWQTQLTAALDSSPHQLLTVVVDALDEAHNPTACIQNVLQPLVAHIRTTTPAQPNIPAQNTPPASALPPPRRLRLIVAARASSAPASHAAQTPPAGDLLGELRRAFPQADIVRTDEADIGDDITAYVHSTLSGPAWDSVPRLRDQAADTVAAHVGHSFLDARLAAEQLAATGPQLLQDPAWPLQLQQGTLGLFRQDLKALTDDSLTPDVALTLLRATAFAFGAGLPRAEIWPAAAQALSLHPLQNVDSHIQRLMNSRLAGYLTHDIEDDRRVYLPAHDQLGQLLRGWPTKGDTALSHPEPGALPDRSNRQAHQRITDALAKLARTDPAGQPHPYLARHLPHHAAAAHLLDDDHLPPTLLPWVSGDTIRGLLHHPHDTRANRTWLTAWTAIEPFIQHADLPSRCSSLHLAHTALHYPGIATHAQGLHGSRIHVLWAQWEPPANVLATTKHPCRTVALTTDPIPPLIALGSEAGYVDLVDARTGSNLGDRIPAHDGAVRRLHIQQDGSRTVLVSGSTDGYVRIWDATERRLLDQLIRRGNSWAADLTGYRAHDGVLTVIAVNGDGEVTEWRENRGERQLATMSAHPLELNAFALLATTTSEGTHVLVCAGETLRIWATATGTLLADHPLQAAVRTLAETPTRGHIAAGHHDGTVTLWDLTTGHCRRIHASDSPVIALACITAHNRHLAAVACTTGIDLWDLTTHQHAGRLTGHTDTVTALHAVPSDQPALLVSCARDNTIRTWTEDALSSALDGADPPPAALAAACRHTDTGVEVAVSYAAAHVQIWNAHTGQPGPTLPLPAHRPATVLAFSTPADEQPQLLYATGDHTITLWDPTTPHTGDQPALTGHILPVRSIATCRTTTGQSLAISGSDDHTVRLWDLHTHQQTDIWKHDFAVLTVAAATHPHGSLCLASGSADGTARLWRPGNPTALHTFRCDQGFINALALDLHAPDGPLLATAGDDTLHLWDLDTCKPRSNHLRGHTDTIEALTAWSTLTPTPRSYIASASRDGTLRIWHTTTSRCILQLATGTRVHTLSARPHSDKPAVTLTITGEAGVAVFDLRLEG
ncbi:hypothetical protein [Streptomyces sp. AC555_RSS877]|uniref:hypothetical protein n=1 Tax=Streptomyces sp. AC555_RSS877 TaxID=2823688 RepID=UPI001C258F50|nr:hypothetical protein [Streptomyces sp. AC555_RSS877]